jgi:outer membrane protein assembly factor BamB
VSFSRRTAVLGAAVLGLALVLTVGSIPGGDVGSSSTVELTRTWLSDTHRQASGNHHAATGARIDGQGRVFAPISGGVHDDDGGHDHAAGHDHGDGHGQSQADGHVTTTTPSSSCGLYALNGSTGEIEWRRTVPAANCSIHSIGDPTVVDVTADAGPAVLATSTTERLTAYHASHGATLFERRLRAHGYTRPIVANLTSEAGPEMLAVDVQGNATLFASDADPAPADGDVDDSRTPWARRWSVDLDGFVWAEPQVVDLNGDGRSTVTIAVGDGRVVAIDPDGSVRWNRSGLPGTDGLTWATSVDAGSAPGRSIVVASSGGMVVRVAGDGTVSWRRDLGAYAAVRATRDAGSRDRSADADADDGGVVYATNRAGDLLALDARSGETLWETTLTDADVQMTPPPSIGDVAGGPAPELVAVTNDGGVHVVDPRDGTMLASGGRSTSIFTHASLVDLDADQAQEIVVTYGDGRIARFDARAGS